MTAPANNASFYASFAELDSLKREAKTQSKDSLRAAAQQFESLFTQMMLKSMRDATKSIGDQLAGSNDVDFYQGMYDQQLAAQLSKGKGLGLADMLVEQLTRSGMVKTDDTSSGAATTSSQAATQVAVPAASNISSADNFQTSTSREEFVKNMWPYADKAAKSLGVSPGTLVAHAALETGWGKNIPCNADGSSSFNFFGIKASSREQGVVASSRTTEYDKGMAVNRVELFKSYASPGQCFEDYAALLKNDPRYAGAQNSGSDANQFAQALQQGGYATDPHYADKLQAVASSLSSWLTRAAQTSSFAGSGRNSGGGIS